MTEHDGMIMNLEFVIGLMVLAYLSLGAVRLSLLPARALKRFGRTE